MRLGLRGRMLLLVLVALAPPTVVAVVVAFEERGDARERAEGDVLASARLAASDTDVGIDATARLLATAAHDLAAHPEGEHCRLLLASIPESTDWYSSVGAVEPDGRVYCRITARGPTRPLKPTNVSGTGWFRRAQQRHGFVLGEFGPGSLSREKALIGSHQIPRESETGHGVVFVTLDLERLTRTAGLNDAPPDTVFVVLDQRGTVVARVPPEGLVGRRLPARALVETVLGRRSGVAEVSGLDGVGRIYGFAPVAGQATGRLFVTAGRSTASAYADPNHDLRRYLLLAGLGLLAALALSYLATGRPRCAGPHPREARTRRRWSPGLLPRGGLGNYVGSRPRWTWSTQLRTRRTSNSRHCSCASRSRSFSTPTASARAAWRPSGSATAIPTSPFS